jgi:glycosyltransferase involved in cell wall biosynthesis
MALRRATGRWVAFLDDDDWWAAEDYLARLDEARPDDSLVYASGRIVREGPGVPESDIIGFRAHADAASLRHNNELLISGIAYDRQLHERLGPYDESLPVYWDWDWYLRLAAVGVRLAPAATDAVCISARADNVTAPAHAIRRQAELARLAAKHGLEGLVLKNHEVIALEQAGLAAP